MTNEPDGAGHRPGGAFLLAQLGAYAADRFARRVAEIGLTPPLVGVLRAVSDEPGCSQQRIATGFGLRPSKVVALIDDLESRDLVERARSTTDRRQHALHLTAEGHSTMRRVVDLARAHDHDLAQALDDADRATLAELLTRLDEQQGFPRVVHPRYRSLR